MSSGIDLNRVYIFDTTMRDGEQSPGASMSLEEKIQISRVFDEMGIDIIFFADWGLGYNLNNSINWNNAIYGYGLGLRIFLMGGVIKLDYGFNPYGTSRLHLF